MMKTKYIALNHGVKKAVQIQQFINMIELDLVEDITLYQKNKMSITLIKNIQSHHYIKVINV